MALDINLVSPFDRSHEKDMWDRFVDTLKQNYDQSCGDVMVLGNFQCERQLDAFVVKNNGIGIIDFKANSGEIYAFQNDSWLANGDSIKASGGINPFYQVKAAKEKVVDRLFARFPKNNRNGSPKWMFTRGWVVFNHPSEINDHLDENVKKWFQVTDIELIAESVLDFKTPTFELDRNQCIEIKNILLGRSSALAKKRVVAVNDAEFQASIRELMCRQGEAQAARGVFESVWQQLHLGRDPLKDIPFDNLTQVENLRAYKISPIYRLLAVYFNGNHYFVNIVTNDQALNWASRNEGLTWTIDPQTGKIRPVQTGVSAALLPGKTTLENKPFLKRIPEVSGKLELNKNEFEKLWNLNEASDDLDFEEALQKIPGESLQDALRDALYLLKADKPDAAKDRLNLYLEELIPLANAQELEQKALESSENSEFLIDLADFDETERARFLQSIQDDKWMYYLHPGQRRVVDEDFSGPVVLTGVSGSGKTSVLLHRAKRLALKYPGQKILVLAFNRHLAAVLSRLLKGLCPQEETFDRIKVVSFHDYLSDLLCKGFDLVEVIKFLGDTTHLSGHAEKFLNKMSPSDYKQLLSPLETSELSELFNDYLVGLVGEERNNFNNFEIFLRSQSAKIDALDYIREEIDLIRGAFPDANYYSGYLGDFPRHGRAIPLQHSRKQQVLDLLQGWEQFQIQNQFLDFMGLAQLAFFAIQKHGSIPAAHRYRCVLVDEFQDFSSFELRLLSGISTSLENGLFLTGDFAQKLYAKQLRLADAGLEAARSHRRSIRKNYRNTRQILDAAHHLLKAYPVPKADDGEEMTILDPELAAFEASKPTAYRASNPLIAAWSDVANWINSGFASHSICIISANEDLYPIEDIIAAKPAGLEAQRLSSWADSDARSVAVSDIASVKGFEFRLVLVIGVDEGVFPPVGRFPGEIWRDAQRLYIAMTRGMLEVRFYFEGRPSEMLKAMGEKISILEWEPTGPAVEPTRQVEVLEQPVVPPHVGDASILEATDLAPSQGGVNSEEAVASESSTAATIPVGAEPATDFARNSHWLLKQRQKLLDLKEAVLSFRESGAGGQVPSSNAWADGSDFEFALSLALVDGNLPLINSALKKIDAGSYGFCEKSGEAIAQKRLEALPYALYTVEMQAEIDAVTPISVIPSTVSEPPSPAPEKLAPDPKPSLPVVPALPKVADSKEPPAKELLPSSAPKFYKSVVGGYRTLVFMTLPSQLELALATGSSTTHIANHLYHKHGLTIVPKNPLRRHLVESICNSLGYVAEFRTSRIEAPVAAGLPVTEPAPQNVAPEIGPEIRVMEIDEEGLRLGELRVTPGGDIFRAVKPRSDREMEPCQIRPYHLAGPNDLRLVIHDIIFDNGERLLTCGENLTLLPKWQRIVHRLKMGVKRLEDETWMMELRQAQTDDRGWARRASVSWAELQIASGMDVGAKLMELGAMAVGTRAVVHGETNKRLNQLCVRFGQPNKVVPVAAFVLATIHPMLRDYHGLV
jgi:superfamily I DNA/RNA helicase/RNA polymerase-binding transcription factor DksA